MKNVVSITPEQDAAAAGAKHLELPLQAASWDIWDKKYRLKSKAGKVVDKTVDDTSKRIAHALADVEAVADRPFWEREFLWALRHGAIPAGRIVSNAGAKEHKPKTSLINCTVSQTVRDSMDDILVSAHQAGLTLKAGCGIGYCFSTLRPSGAYVAGAGASTSGPLSFMDIFDKICATVASAGGRRGAQMGTFDVQHPDVEAFIRAKREDGRLRQFNLSLLITQDFIRAVESDSEWPLVFPVMGSEKDEIDFEDPTKVIWRDWENIEDGYTVREDGKVACKVYRTIKARKLWNLIMASTYDYAEPGFLLIDRVNQENNNWWCENIRASNPCVTANTVVRTDRGSFRVHDLIGTPFNALINGVPYATDGRGFFHTGCKQVFAITTATGKCLEATDNHLVMMATGLGMCEWRPVADLRIGDTMVLHNHDRLSGPIAIESNGRGTMKELVVEEIVSIDCVGYQEVYDVSVPGANAFDANGFYVHNCGEQMLPPAGACLLGSVNLTCFVSDAFTPKAAFDWATYRKVVRVFTRMLDNVVEVNGLPLQAQRDEIMAKRRHGMGFLGLGSAMTMLGMRYGSKASVEFTDEVSKTMAVEGWREALDLAKEKGPAPILAQEFEVTPTMLAKRPAMGTLGWKVGDKIKGAMLHARFSKYMQRIAEVDPKLVEELCEVGARFTHHTSIAPTGTIALSIGNNASNGIEPSFAHSYSRNVIRPGKKTKEKVEVMSYELMAYRALIDAEADPDAKEGEHKLPDYFVAADTVTPTQHVDIQAASQKWVDSSISKTINVATDIPFKEFQGIYLYAARSGLKGCTTFRFNPNAFQGVLVKEKDLANTTYRFQLEDGSVIEARGNDEVEYDGEIHTAANLFDALKEGYYGKF